MPNELSWQRVLLNSEEGVAGFWRTVLEGRAGKPGIPVTLLLPAVVGGGGQVSRLLSMLNKVMGPGCVLSCFSKDM